MTKFDPTKPVRTRSGLPARIICTDRKGSAGLSIVALVDTGEYEGAGYYYDNGRLHRRETDEWDLINIPPLTIEAGKLYRSANGKKVFISHGRENHFRGIMEGQTLTSMWEADGGYHECEDWNLIEEIKLA